MISDCYDRRALLVLPAWEVSVVAEKKNGPSAVMDHSSFMTDWYSEICLYIIWR